MIGTRVESLNKKSNNGVFFFCTHIIQTGKRPGVHTLFEALCSAQEYRLIRLLHNINLHC